MRASPHSSGLLAAAQGLGHWHAQARRERLEHVARHGVQVKVVAPPPLVAGDRVVDRGGPRVRDLLPEVGLVRDGEARDVLADGVGQLGGREGEGGEVVHARARKLVLGSLQQVQRALQAGKAGVRSGTDKGK